jgi:hypothetical protein
MLCILTLLSLGSSLEFEFGVWILSAIFERKFQNEIPKLHHTFYCILMDWLIINHSPSSKNGSITIFNDKYRKWC